MRNGQFSLEYNEDATLSGRVYTNNGWAESKTRMPSGQWVQISLTYNGTLFSLFVNGQLEAEVNHEGYLSWGDGTDHSLYLNRYAQTGMEGKAIFDDVRIYNRS